MINHQTPAPTRPRSAEGLTAYIARTKDRRLMQELRRLE